MRTSPACSLEPSSAVEIHGAATSPTAATASDVVESTASAVEIARRTAG